MTTRRLIIFTDLDGTLLDRDTYSFEGAQPALRLIRQRDIPLVLTSSKTRAEIQCYRKELENIHPFISENGGGIFIPKGYFSFPLPYHRECGGFLVMDLGTAYPSIVAVLNSIKEETGLPIKGFSDLTEEELTFLCGLRPREAGLAKKREFDEPFLVNGGEKEVEIVRRKIEGKGMTYAWGGRFHHILGKNDKGKAVEVLKELFEKQFLSITTVGIGDSLNDLPMLCAVDRPILLMEEQVPLPEILSSVRNLTTIDGTGPQAWNRAILSFLN